MTRYTGRCHCGAVSFTFDVETIVDGMRCNCSMCRRKSSLLSSFTLTPEVLSIAAASDATSVYQFGTNVAKHHFCRTCGVHPFTETRLRPGEFRINLGCIDGLDMEALTVIPYDGQAI